jgi:hypothetical protein
VSPWNWLIAAAFFVAGMLLQSLRHRDEVGALRRSVEQLEHDLAVAQHKAAILELAVKGKGDSDE